LNIIFQDQVSIYISNVSYTRPASYPIEPPISYYIQYT